MFLSDAGGVGLNLQRAASCCINLELPWNPAVLEQRIGRIHRLGQKAPIDVYNLVSEEGIEANIAKLLGKKSAVFSSLFDGTTDAVVFDGQASFLEGVKKLVDPVSLPLVGASDDGDEAGADERVDSEPGVPSAERAEVAQSNGRSGALSVTRLEDGGLRIEAPPHLAAPLAELLEALAKSLRGGAEMQITE